MLVVHNFKTWHNIGIMKGQVRFDIYEGQFFLFKLKENLSPAVKVNTY